MNPILRRVMGINEDESEGEKLFQPQVLYMTPEMLNKSGQTDPGARCGKCIFFNTPKSECFVTTPPHCDAEHGVCGSFIGGETFLKESATPLELLPKEAAGYTEDGPTHCGNCEYYSGGKDEGTCKKVQGPIYWGGCCNGWESNDEEKEEAEKEEMETEK